MDIFETNQSIGKLCPGRTNLNFCFVQVYVYISDYQSCRFSRNFTINHFDCLIIPFLHSYHRGGHIGYSLALSVVRYTIYLVSVFIYVTTLSLDYTIVIIFPVRDIIPNTGRHCGPGLSLSRVLYLSLIQKNSLLCIPLNNSIKIPEPDL